MITSSIRSNFSTDSISEKSKTGLNVEESLVADSSSVDTQRVEAGRGWWRFAWFKVHALPTEADNARLNNTERRPLFIFVGATGEYYVQASATLDQEVRMLGWRCVSKFEKLGEWECLLRLLFDDHRHAVTNESKSLTASLFFLVNYCDWHWRNRMGLYLPRQ